MTTNPTLVPAGAMFICGTGGCDSTHYLKCTDCGLVVEAPEDPAGDGDQLALDLFAPPEHTRLDCLRRQREHPKPTPARRTPKQQRAHNAYQRGHEQHRPVRMVRRHGALTCPLCGFQP